LGQFGYTTSRFLLAALSLVYVSAGVFIVAFYWWLVANKAEREYSNKKTISGHPVQTSKHFIFSPASFHLHVRVYRITVARDHTQ
jgi:hypothetical protein